MRWLGCSYQDVLNFPDAYVEVASDMSRKEAAAQRDAARRRR